MGSRAGPVGSVLASSPGGNRGRWWLVAALALVDGGITVAAGNEKYDAAPFPVRDSRLRVVSDRASRCFIPAHGGETIPVLPCSRNYGARGSGGDRDRRSPSTARLLRPPVEPGA